VESVGVVVVVGLGRAMERRGREVSEVKKEGRRRKREREKKRRTWSSER